MVDEKIDKRTKAYKQAQIDKVVIAPEIIKEEPIKPETDVTLACPYCLSMGRPGTRLDLSTKYQCLDCGKNWKSSAFGQPYSEALERA